VPLRLSTLTDQLGVCVGVLTAILERIRAHVLFAERLCDVDTTVSVLAKGRTGTAHLWTDIHDDQPLGDADPPTEMSLARVRIAAPAFLLVVEHEFPERVDTNVLIPDKGRSHPI
jgi:hypothetical protein